MDAVAHGIIDFKQVQADLEMAKNKELLAKHPYVITKRKDGKYYTYLPDEVYGRVQRRRNTLEEIERVVIEYQRDQLYNPTLEEVFKEWNDSKWKKGKISAATRSKYQREFNRYYAEIKNTRIKAIDPTELGFYLEEQIPKYQLRAKAFSNLKTITKGFFKRAKRRGLIDFSIEDIFKEMDVSEHEFKKVVKKDAEMVFTEEEYPVMKKYLVENPDLRNLGILLMLLTGLRIGELVALKKENLVDNLVCVRRTETKYTDETGKTVYEVKDSAKTDAAIRDVPMPKDFLWVLDRLRENDPEGEFVFSEGGKRLTQNCIRQRQYRVCEKIGIVSKSPHKNRATYATLLYESGASDAVITKLMGHADIQTTRQHYVKNRKNIDAAADIVNNISALKAQ